MAVAKSTLNFARGNSSLGRPIKWSSFDSGANNVYFDVNAQDVSKMILLVAAESTLTQRWYIGTSASASSHTSKKYPYSAAGLGRVLIRTTAEAALSPVSVFKSTLGGSAASPVSDSEVIGIYALGPFETARYKDSRGYISVCRAKTTVGAVSDSAQNWVAAILLP